MEKLVHTHRNLVLRESLDDTLHHLLPWDIELIIDEPVDQTEEEPEVVSVHDFYSYLLRLLRDKTHAWSKRTSIKHLFFKSSLPAYVGGIH